MAENSALGSPGLLRVSLQGNRSNAIAEALLPTGVNRDQPRDRPPLSGFLRPVIPTYHGGDSMLVLSRKVDETITIGHNIRITVTAIRGRQVRIAIDAPEDLTIVRGELIRIPVARLARPVDTRRPS